MAEQFTGLKGVLVDIKDTIVIQHDHWRRIRPLAKQPKVLSKMQSAREKMLAEA
jgi:hypothetical protein